jgi:signal transduction histidine kinase
MSAVRKLGIMGVMALVVAVGAILWFLPRGPALTAFGDLTPLLMMVAASIAMFWNGWLEQRARAFWMLLGAGCLMWTVNQWFWTYYEVILKRDLPDPFLGDVILFLHIVPFMAAVALRPHRPRKDRKVLIDTVNFLMLLVWWVFLYMFVVFPDEFVTLNAPVYSRHYDILYLVENLALVLTLGMVASSTRGNWRRIYWNLFLASGLYTLGSELIDVAITRKQYYTGSLYDLLLLVAIGWFLWTPIMARRMDLAQSTDDEPASRWVNWAPRLAMMAILSLPLLGLWTLFADHSAAHLRNFRLLVTMAATLVLGLFVFFKQFLLDRQLISLLDQSRKSYENLQRLQTHLVQKEKLASLGQLVAGAAHEINNPLAAILGYSELLAAQPSLHGDQASMAEKIGQQARRTRDLVADLLSFSQQNPSEKVLVDVSALAQRALQMHESQVQGRNIRVEPDLPAGLPRIWGNTNQLLQTFLHLTENAIDALAEVGGGILAVRAWHEEHDVVIEFSDSGPGIRDPQRVFDPFYTTKPIGKGTGLGLSASYGVVQDHQGQITCHNRPQGGAAFLLRFPVASQAAAAVEAGSGL